ncbi:MAG: alpha/beta hydrolase [Fimbriimonadaceae bacterium]|nr:alpha/beta hydrolase [Fimbriimonadaceae bacterium]
MPTYRTTTRVDNPLRVEHPVAPALQPRPFFMLSGLAADHRLFEEQIREFPHLRTPSWIRPRNGESLPEYADRFARWLNIQPGSIIGGYDFGSMVALEMARRPWIRDMIGGVVLVSGIRSRREVPGTLKLKAKLAGFVNDEKLRKKVVRHASRFCSNEPLSKKMRSRLVEMAERCDLEFLRWAMNESAGWRFSNPATELGDLPLLQIHGRQDRFVAPPAGSTVLVEGGHLIAMTHASVVNETIRRWAANL